MWCLLLTFPELFQLVEAYQFCVPFRTSTCLISSPVVKQLMQMVTMVPGWGGWSQSVCFPNISTDSFQYVAKNSVPFKATQEKSRAPVTTAGTLTIHITHHLMVRCICPFKIYLHIIVRTYKFDHKVGSFMCFSKTSLISSEKKEKKS